MRKPFPGAVVLALSGAVLWAADDQYGFMPDGGRAILLRLAEGMEADALRDLLSREAAAADWTEWARARDPELDETAARTLAGYAELNLPVDGTLDGMSAQEMAGRLPRDGKDLAVAQCQFCHSLFSGYLMHDRDKAGWESTFKAPFHTEIPMSAIERETFAGYSALNMPLAFEEVPPELRF